MKNKKAFTLTELLAVIIILAVVMSITVPIVTKQMDKYEKKLCQTQYQSILKAARSYGADHALELESKNTITLEDLIKGGYLESKKIKDPVTKKEISSTLEIKITKLNNSYEYSFLDTSSMGCADSFKKHDS